MRPLQSRFLRYVIVGAGSGPPLILGSFFLMAREPMVAEWIAFVLLTSLFGAAIGAIVANVIGEDD